MAARVARFKHPESMPSKAAVLVLSSADPHKSQTLIKPPYLWQIHRLTMLKAQLNHRLCRHFAKIIQINPNMLRLLKHRLTAQPTGSGCTNLLTLAG